jgi:hypothetical protein
MIAPHTNVVLQAPAVQALLIQVLSFLVLSGFLYLAVRFANIHVTSLAVGLMQGGLAAFVSRLRKLAPWWWIIQFLFPIALIVVPSLGMPPILFLLGFIFLLGLYWTTFRTQVPFYPSGPVTWEAVADLLPQDRSIRFIDVGSGLGGLIIRLAKMRSESYFVGIEVAPLPWLVSFLRARITRSGGRFVRGDYCRLDFAEYDVVFAYLSPAAMPSLWEKARAEMRPDSLLLSYEFPIPGVKSHIIIMPVANGPALFCWRM